MTRINSCLNSSLNAETSGSVNQTLSSVSSIKSKHRPRIFVMNSEKQIRTLADTQRNFIQLVRGKIAIFHTDFYQLLNMLDYFASS
jgi:hypothetical protein